LQSATRNFENATVIATLCMKEGPHTDPVAIGARILCMFVKQGLVSVAARAWPGPLQEQSVLLDLRHDALDVVTARALKRPLFVTGLFGSAWLIHIIDPHCGHCGSFGSSGILGFAIVKAWGRPRIGVDSIFVIYFCPTEVTDQGLLLGAPPFPFLGGDALGSCRKRKQAER
jgi:hypothetical protein